MNKIIFLLWLSVVSSALAQEVPQTIKIIKYMKAPSDHYATVNLTTSRGTSILALCESVPPHPITVPQKDGTTVMLKNVDGTPQMSEMNCSDLLEHVGETIQLVGSQEFMGLGFYACPKDDDFSRWTTCLSNYMHTIHFIANRKGKLISFSFHKYDQKTDTQEDSYAEVTIVEEKAKD